MGYDPQGRLADDPYFHPFGFRYLHYLRAFAVIRKAGKTDRKLTANVIAAASRGNKTGALQACSTQNTPLARMLQKGLLLYHIPAQDLRTSMENTATLEIAELEKGLPTLATVSGLAPMIGFLGTVVGMVQAFYDMSLAGNNINITLLSRGYIRQ